MEGYAGALDVDRVNKVFIQGSTFQGNSSTVYGGAAVFVRTKDIVIEDTSFFGSEARKGGALYVSYESPWVIGATLSPPFSADKGPAVTLRAVNRDVVFRDNVATDGEGSDFYIMKASSKTPYLNLSAKAGRRIELNGEIFLDNTAGSRREPENRININTEPDDTGEVVLNGDIRSRWHTGGWGQKLVAHDGQAYVILGGGTLSLGNPMALANSRLIVPKGGNPTLNMTAIHPDATDPVELYEIGFLDAANQTLDLLVDVDLEKGVADTLRFGGFKSYRNILRVAGWNVLSDVPAGAEEVVVTLAADEVQAQRVYYGLAPEAVRATGALYVYDVSVANPDPYEEDLLGPAESSDSPWRVRPRSLTSINPTTSIRRSTAERSGKRRRRFCSTKSATDFLTRVRPRADTLRARSKVEPWIFRSRTLTTLTSTTGWRSLKRVRLR